MKHGKPQDLPALRIRFMERTLKFTEKVTVWVTLLYIVNWLVSVVLIGLAIYKTDNFAYLDTLITETSETFRSVVGIAIIKFGVENIFKYNNFGGKVPTKASEPETEPTENTIKESEETISDDTEVVG
nr:MAG TPA: hypothetical protein [Herelleviridae sp.]